MAVTLTIGCKPNRNYFSHLPLSYLMLVMHSLLSPLSLAIDRKT